MIRSKDLRDYAIRATDGAIGKVDDLYFDDKDWAIRYLVVDTGGWLFGRKVLISPIAVGKPDWTGETLPVSLTKDQVEKSPDIDTRKPVSRQHEAAYFGYYGYPYYWGGGGLWGMGAYPGNLTTQDRIAEQLKAQQMHTTEASADTHLRSCSAVIGNHVHATDGDIGHVEDLLVDDHTWAIRYLIVNTSNWWGGHYVLVAPQKIKSVSWSDRRVSVDLSSQAIRDAPAYDRAARPDGQPEPGVYKHRGVPDDLDH
ncbi:MAG: PRC-barrel domain-containing protein [Acidobacteriota bacterium]|nr:PRC-barrel domain-containing protein [Acidobacteriota bacterium]